MIVSIQGRSLLTRVFVTILINTLHKLIGQNFDKCEGFSSLEMTAIRDLLVVESFLPEMRATWTTLTTSEPMMFKYFDKKEE